MIDFHSHILPGIDDGSSSRQESIDMISLLSNQNVHSIVATPHFYANEISVSRFLKRRQNSYECLLQEMDKRNLQYPKLYLGAEVYYFKGIGMASQVQELCVQNSNLLLLEMPFCQWDDSMLKDIRDLITKAEVTLILAHIERYYSFQKDKTVWNEIWNLPIYAQMNAGSFLDKGGLFKKGKKKFCFEFMELGNSVLLGSDCHNMDSRRPNIQQACRVISQEKGEELLAKLDACAERLLLNVKE